MLSRKSNLNYLLPLLVLALFAASKWSDAQTAVLGPYPEDVMSWDATVREAQREAGKRLLEEIDAAVQRGDREILIAKGDYRFSEATGAPSLPAHIIMARYEDVTIDFQGSTLWFETQESGIRLTGCKNLVIKNVHLDWDPLPYFQGHIVAIDEANNTLDVKFDSGYGERILPGMREGGYWRGIGFDKHTRKIKQGVVGFGVVFSWDKLQDDGSYRMPFRGFGSVGIGQSGLAVGDPIVLLDRMGRAVRVENCENVLLEDITLYSAPFIGFVENTGVGNTHYVRCSIILRKDTNRLISGNADGFNISNVEVGPTIDSCVIENIGDDFVNIHNDFARVLKQEGPNTLISSRLCYRNEVDGVVAVEFFDRKTFQPLGRRTATVEVVRHYAISRDDCLADLDHKWHSGEAASLAYGKTMWAVHRLRLDEPIDIAGDVIVNCVNYMSSGSVIRDCSFTGSLARGVRLQAPGATIENNEFSWIMSIGISMGSHANYWGEGSYVADTVVIDNVISGTCLGRNIGWNRAAIFIQLGGSADSFQILRNISIENNDILGSGDSAILAFGVNGLTISGNTIEHYVIAPVYLPQSHGDEFVFDQKLATAAIGLDKITNLTLTDNRITSPGDYAKDEVVMMNHE